MHRLVGRDDDLSACWHLLSTGRRLACVTGEPGAGKTGLLDALDAQARDAGWEVIRLRGRASERALPYAGVVELLAARQVHLGPDLRRRAAEVSADLVGPRPGQAPTSALALRLGILDWLADAATERPLMVVVDDQHWWDDSSWDVLSFVANRLAGTSVAVLVATRALTSARGVEEADVVALAPLGLEQSLALLDTLELPLGPVARISVTDRARGNPLALREFARTAGSVTNPMDPDTRLGSLAASEPPAVPPKVEAAFAAELPGLPATTRRVLLLAAAGGADLPVLSRVVADPPESHRTRGGLARDLGPAEESGLISVVDGRVRFRHPLVRSTVYAQASTAERLAAHRDLADAYVDDPARGTWHRAAATTGPDDDLALELVRAAGAATGRGAHSEGARAMLRAAELSSRRADRESRMLEALVMLGQTGQLGRLQALSERVLAETDDPKVRALAAHRVAYAMAQSMRQTAALDALEGSLDELLRVEPESGWASLTTLASLTYQTGRGADRVRVWYDRYRRDAPPAPPPYDQVTRAAQAWIETALAPLSRAPQNLALVRETPPLDLELPGELLAPQEMMLGATAWLLDEPEVAMRRLEKSVELQRQGNAPGQLIQTLMALGQVQFDRAAFADAALTARTMIDLAEADNLGYYLLTGRELLARVTVVLGDPEVARSEALALLRAVDVGECAALEANLHVTLARASFTRGDLAAAYRYGRALFDRDGAPLHEHVSYRALGDLVAVAVRAGERDDVLGVVERARGQLEATTSPRFAVILQRALGLLAEGDEAEAYLELATSEPSAARWPFELAHARLGYGVWLRRRRRTAAARAQLALAQEAFARVGAITLAEAAAAELRAAGVSTEEASPSSWSELTAQERQIARLAAAGLTNREIGKRLFLSPRTVSTHLYHAFPKLGVTSRTQLRDVVERLSG
ncbi:AAA family ATPase [Nocardioides mangrovi]|uniref:AAA family ATPase n=1 Tax=Nocardioides mangrovi TaxID=2874580 RepID=A0ABS7UCZ5_9ACTN|nr:LuxR family transcriptional regulator [Nocardioides mangrovi]MBZ5738757.1 AAA family ATPase [Nocardioides mangrovi]